MPDLCNLHCASVVKNILSFQTFPVLGVTVHIDGRTMPHVWVLGKGGGTCFEGDLGESSWVWGENLTVGGGPRPDRPRF